MEAAGDVDVLLLDKTGTITLGNRQATEFIPGPGVTEKQLAEARQVERAMRRPGAREADVRARLRRQAPLEEKRKYADFVIDTSGEKASTLRQTRAVYDALRRIQS